MRSNALLSLSLVLFSFALPACSAYPPFGPYNITSYVSDCVLGECYYSFNITFAPDTSYPPAYQSDTEPAFGPTKCEGSDQQSGFVACEDSNISTNITKLSGDVGNLLVQHSRSILLSLQEVVWIARGLRLWSGIMADRLNSLACA